MSSMSPPSSRGDRFRLGATPVLARWTTSADGDLAPDRTGGPRPQWRRAVLDRPWSWLRQVHGGEVRVLSSPGECAGLPGDALVTRDGQGCLAVFSADCPTVALASPEGVMGAVHAGWRGLMAGVVQAAVDAMRDLGATEVRAGLGPFIGPECYRFSAPELDDVVARFGPSARSTTASGQDGLDLGEVVRLATVAAGAQLVPTRPTCTACSSEYFSHRARADRSRQALVVWRPVMP